MCLGRGHSKQTGRWFARLSEMPHGRFRFGMSVPLLLEYRAKMLDTIASGETALSSEQIDAILSALAHYGVEVPVYFRLRPNLADESDNMVFECAVNSAAGAIVTYNVRDFTHPELKGYGIEVLRPGEFLKRIRRGQ